MLVKIECPHRRAEQYVDTHWITKQTDRIRCGNCGNDYPAHLWQVKRKQIFIFR